MKSDLSILISFIIYLSIMLGIGIVFYKKSNNMDEYFLGGRQLNSWVTAMSAQASDMSGWLLMGLPAAAYMSGLSSGWIAIGLALGTYLNWKIVAARLRRFTGVVGDSITIPQYLQNRFLSKSVTIRAVSAIIIFVFFLIYTASAFHAGAILFQHVFHLSYIVSLTISALVVVSYTFLGGFLAVCWTDLIQGFLMFFAIIVVPVSAILSTPDFSATLITEIGGENFLSLFSNNSGDIPPIQIFSNIAWLLGYFGMPHILTKFMAIQNSGMIKKSRHIAMTWVVISLSCAILVGIVGRVFLTGQGIFYSTPGEAEVVFMEIIMNNMPGLLAGILLSAILSAIMSTADSQLLVTASAIANDLYQPLFRKNASPKELLNVSRIAVIIVSVIAFIIALDPNSSVMGLVSYAWAGFGAAFGPVILLSLFWRRMTLKGAIAGMITGGLTILIWENVPLLFNTGLYSIVPGFFLALIVIIAVSLLDKEPSKELYALYDKAKASDI